MLWEEVDYEEKKWKQWEKFKSSWQVFWRRNLCLGEREGNE
jgi:hypothetical protein